MIDKFVNILKSPRFWAAVLIVVFVILQTSVPAIAQKIDQKALTSSVIALVSFIAAATVSNVPTGANLFGQLKFWSLIASLAFVFIKAFVPSFVLTEDVIQALIASLGAVSFTYSYRPVNTSLPPSK
jgi:uncharacterized membrane protein